jgi:hypothetical protein
MNFAGNSGQCAPRLLSSVVGFLEPDDLKTQACLLRQLKIQRRFFSEASIHAQGYGGCGFRAVGWVSP